MKRNKLVLGLFLSILCIILGGCMKKENVKKNLEETDLKSEEDMLAILTLNMPLGPDDRVYMFEEPIDEVLRGYGVGEVTGGGTYLSKEGIPISCDLEFSILKKYKDNFIKFIQNTNTFAKGSYLKIDGEKIEVGTLEGLSLTLNGVDLDKKIYEENDAHDVINELSDKLANIGEYYGSYEGDAYTKFYFYGESYDEMKKVVLEYTKTCPLCKLSKIEKLV